MILKRSVNMDDDLGLELDDSFEDLDGSPPFRGRGRGRRRSGFRSSRGSERFTFKTRAFRGFRGGRGAERFISSRGRGRGDGIRRGLGESRRGHGLRITYDYESPRDGYKDRKYENSRDYSSDYRSPSSYNSYENGYSSRGRRGSGRGPSRGGYSRRDSFDHYEEKSSYAASKGFRDYQDHPRRGYEASYSSGRESKFDKYRDEGYPSKDYKYRGSPYKKVFRRATLRMSPPPRRMSPPPRFRSRSPVMMRSRSPIGRVDRFRGSSRGSRRAWTPPPPPRRERSRSPMYIERGPPRDEFHDRGRFRGRGGRGFRSRGYPPLKPGFRSKGSYSGERY